MKKIIRLTSALVLSTLLCACNEKPVEVKLGTDTTPVTTQTTETKPVETTTPELAAATFYTATAYKQLGTGPKKTAETAVKSYYSASPLFDESNYHLTNLSDAQMASTVNAWIDQTVAECRTSLDKLQTLAETNASLKMSYEKTPVVYGQVINGYLSVYVTGYYDQVKAVKNEYDIEHLPFFFESAFFDLYTGKQLAVSDLFYEGVDFVSYYNRQVNEKTQKPVCLDGFVAMTIPQKREFTGLTEDCFQFSFHSIVFPYGNPFFTMGFELYMDFENGFLLENSVVWQQRDMSGLFPTEDIRHDEIYVADKTYEFEQQGTIGNIILDGMLVRSTVLDDAKIEQMNRVAREIAGDSRTDALLTEVFGHGSRTPMYVDDWFDGYLLYMQVFREKNVCSVSINQESGGGYCLGLSFYYDLNTLEQLSNAEVFSRLARADWQTTYTIQDVDGSLKELRTQELLAHMDEIHLSDAYAYDDGNFTIQFQYGKDGDRPVFYIAHQ